jgi:type II secretory pathway component PulM
MTLNDRLQALRDKWERLSQRERTMVGALGVTFVVLVTLVVGFLITDGLETLEEHNAEMRQALRDLDTQRDSYLKLKAKSQQIEVRLGSTPPQLGGYLEQAAKESGVEIGEQDDIQPIAAGKSFVEKSVHVRLHPVTLEQLVKFLKAIENGRNLVVVTQLHANTRDDKHEQLDVEMTVSTYVRDTTKPATHGAKADKS